MTGAARTQRNYRIGAPPDPSDASGFQALNGFMVMA